MYFWQYFCEIYNIPIILLFKGDRILLCFPGWSWASRLKSSSCLTFPSMWTVSTYYQTWLTMKTQLFYIYLFILWMCVHACEYMYAMGMRVGACISWDACGRDTIRLFPPTMWVSGKQLMSPGICMWGRLSSLTITLNTILFSLLIFLYTRTNSWEMMCNLCFFYVKWLIHAYGKDCEFYMMGTI